jgi:hypothetical protein
MHGQAQPCQPFDDGMFPGIQFGDVNKLL